MTDLSAITCQPWAITPEWLATIDDIANRRGEDLEALEARLGRRLDNTRRVSLRDGVATIPIDGPIFPRANLMMRLSGAVSPEVLATDITTAIEDPAVKALLFTFDSPGGAVAGINELSDLIYAARDAKPMASYVGGTAASAALWLASATGEIVADATAEIGSIGVVAGIRDTREADQKAGIRRIEIVSSQTPAKRLDPLTDDGRSDIQRRVDAVAEVFIGALARNLGIDRAAVVEQFLSQSMFVGAEAVAVGLAHRLGSYESLHAELSGAAPRRRLSSPAPGPRATATAQGGNLTMSDTQKAPANQPDQPPATAGTTIPATTTATTTSSPPATTTAAAGPPAQAATEGKVVDINSARSEGAAAEAAYALEVTELCALGRQPERAAEFLRAKTPIADIRKALLNDAAVQAQAAGLNTHHAPAGAGAPANYGWDNSFARVASFGQPHTANQQQGRA